MTLPVQILPAQRTRHWRIHRLLPDTPASPASLENQLPEWQGRCDAPEICTLIEEPDPDRFDWWLVSAIDPGPDCTLVFPEVFGIAEFWVGDRCISISENAFVPWRVVLGARSEAATFGICLRSMDERLQARRPRPRWSTNLVRHPQLRWFRQPLTGRLRGWSDSCPRLGIGAPPHQDDAAFSVDVAVSTGLANGVPVLQVSCRTSRPGERLEVRVGDVATTARLMPLASGHQGEVALTLPELETWFPHTHGRPALHSLEVRLDDQVVHATQVGFRSLLLDEESCALSVNGRQVFLRGACLVSPPKGDDLIRLLEQTVSAGFNMVRITGISGYADDALLAACDAAGVLVWQDLPLASMDYPQTPEFLATLSSELACQLPRIGRHPCLAIVCGAADVQQQATYHGLDRKRRAPGLLEVSIAQTARQLLPEIPFVADTPVGGDLPTHVGTGFSSFFAIGAYRRPLSDRSVDQVRFATECLGFANIPDDRSLREMFGTDSPSTTSPEWKRAVPRDANTGWDFDDVRDHYTEALFGVNTRDLRFSAPREYLDCARLASGLVMSRVLARWRSGQSRCQGALLWTLRDTSPGSGWGLIDSLGREKPAWHQVQSVCQPVQALLFDDGLDGHSIRLINDTPTSIEARLEVVLVRPDGRRGSCVDRPVTLPAHSSTGLSVDGLFGRFQDTTWAHRFGPRPFAAAAVQLHSPDVESVQVSEVGDLRIRVAPGEAAVDARVQCDQGQWLLTIESDCLLQWVRIDSDGWRVHTNYVHVLPGVPRHIRLEPEDPAPVGPRIRLRPFNCEHTFAVQVTADAA